MQWFSGDIAAAVSLAKSKSAIFVVYCEGQDENSSRMTEMMNDESVSSKLQSDSFVAIRIKSDKPEYEHFRKIYQLVPIPSLFFIKNGIPIKIVTSVIKTTNELLEAIDGILKTQINEATIKTVETKEQDPKIVCDGDRCYKIESDQASSSKETESTEKKSEEESEEEKQEKVKRALKLIEEKRIERIKEEQRLEKEREIRRRQEGQQLQNLKKWQDEQEMLKLQDERKREKLAAAEARKRVLQQIEEDKKERARRFNSTPPTNEEPTKKVETIPQTSATTIPPNSARIQFKKPDGGSEIVTFDSNIPFADLHAFVKTDILNGTNIKEFTLATTFPRCEFSQTDFNKTLIELNLAPSSVILIIPGKRTATNNNNNANTILPTQTDGSMLSMVGALIMGLFSPVFALFTYLKNFIFRSQNSNEEESSNYGLQKRNEETLAPNDAAKRRNMDRFNGSQNQASTSSQAAGGAIPKTGAYKRMKPSSNIHRLHEDSDTDNEERKTYNGNSTQQM
ncbi:hypothetical protein PVAND_008180 [Polypedilum vanderplanki]|uniref:UBX domain-containing protein 4 n=1 Tax=Polypedilum vanderplanki TaxID=319348 RepID=A0A9J6C8W1_POLVA|nr:hypothetical protein PVAND_008180 [Polypedilum vanderplanki]